MSDENSKRNPTRRYVFYPQDSLFSIACAMTGDGENLSWLKYMLQDAGALDDNGAPIPGYIFIYNDYMLALYRNDPRQHNQIPLLPGNLNMKTNVLEETHTYQLTDEEKSLVEKYRAEQKAVQDMRFVQLKLLKLAYEFEKWIQENGTGSSFSTFVDEFGYQGSQKETVAFVHDRINQLRYTAYGAAEEMVTANRY